MTLRQAWDILKALGALILVVSAFFSAHDGEYAKATFAMCGAIFLSIPTKP